MARHEVQSLKLLNEELDQKSKELIELKSAFARSRKSLENRVCRNYSIFSPIGNKGLQCSDP